MSPAARPRIQAFTSTFVVIPHDNIDTDQIIPARFLTTTDRDGLGHALFADWRYDATGAPRAEFPLNQPAAHGAQVLVAGENFGCGSSREHAPWALLGHGFRAVISTHFADIFRSNALKNGLLPIVVSAEEHARLVAHRDKGEVTVDLARQHVVLPDGSRAEFPIDAFAKHCLLNGVDELGFLLDKESIIAAFEESHPGRIDTLAASEVGPA